MATAAPATSSAHATVDTRGTESPAASPHPAHPRVPMEPVTRNTQVAARATAPAQSRHSAIRGATAARLDLSQPRYIPAVIARREPSRNHQAYPCVRHVRPGHILARQVR